MEEIQREENLKVLKILKLLKQASHDLQSDPSRKLTESNSSAIKALLELETESETILSDPHLTQLSKNLSYLKTLVDTLYKTRGQSLRSFLNRRISTHKIARVAQSIESEIQSWIDREFIESLVKALRGSALESSDSDSVTELITLLTQFHDRVSEGFNRELQDLMLKAGIFTELETILIDPTRSIKLREKCAFIIEALIRFNKNVFVGEVLMGPTINSLISMSSISSLKVLCSLIKSIKSPIVDEIEANKGIRPIIGFLDSNELAIQVLGLECVLEIGYFGRKEAIEAMMNEDIVKKLVELQRSELGGDLIDVNKSAKKKGKEGSEESYLERHPFASCVRRFSVQLEVGEGLRQREKRGFKQEIMRRVKEACVSDAEVATILIEVLWGSFF